MRHSRILGLLLLSFSGFCGAMEEVREVPQAAAPAEGTVGKWLQPTWTPISPEAQIFLVAGGRDSANFAQEIIDQKKFWLASGYAENQIACFFASPSPTQKDDAQQFLALAEELRRCHLAAPEVVYAALATVARNYQQPTFYLYVTSHGSSPALTTELPDSVRRSPGSAWFAQAQEEARADPASAAWTWFSPYRMELEGVMLLQQRGWGWTSFSARYRDLRVRQGASPEAHLFTPRYLARALRQFPAAVRKIVVLQGCHSGGFVLPADQAPAPEETLTTVDNITVLTASRADRTSFGCAVSDHTTYYGGALQKVLDVSPGRKVPDWDWRQVHEDVAGEVQQIESGQRIGRRDSSLPQFFTAPPAEPAP